MTDEQPPMMRFTEYQAQQEDLRIRRMEAENQRIAVLRDGQLVVRPPQIDMEAWAKLTAEFPPDEVNLLPKGKGSGDEITCSVCGGRHKERGIFHVPYVGHARVTQRLNDVDPGWIMEPGPIVVTADGLVYMTAKMTVLGVTRHEVGCADTDDDEWPKQVYSDAVTRCAMRFGVATYLWAKVKPGEERTSSGRRRAPQSAPPPNPVQQRDPTVAAMLDVLQADVKNLDLVGAAAWQTWKSDHYQWWTKIESLTEARDYVIGLLVESASDEPF